MALLATGCGGLNVRAVALKQANSEVNPSVVRIETLPADGDGVRYALVLLKADSAFNVLCARVPYRRGRASRDCHSRYESMAVALDVGNNVTSPGNVCCKSGISASQLDAIARARRVNSVLHDFPYFPGWPFPCSIPRRNSSASGRAGKCYTIAQPWNHVRYVNFTQYWKRSTGRWGEDHWIVTFGPTGRVESISHPSRFSSRDIRRLLR